MIVEETKLGIFLIASILVLTSTEAHSHRNSSENCRRSCGNGDLIRWVQYPFGFSPDCGIKLNCDEQTGDFKIGDLKVQNIIPNGIFVSLPAECNRSLDSIRPLSGRFFAPSLRNELLLQNCSSSRSTCVIPSITSQLDSKSCDAKSDNISCFSVEKSVSDVLSYENLSSTQCKFAFSSFAVGASSPGVSQISLEFERVELEWWLAGNCRDNGSCHRDGSCKNVSLGDGSTGFRCWCNEGFTGDGFRLRQGCRRGNPFLCGQLTRTCSSTLPPPSSYIVDKDEANGFMDLQVFYITFVICYVIVLLSSGAALYINPYRRRRWFYMIQVMITNCDYFIQDNVLPLLKFRAS